MAKKPGKKSRAKKRTPEPASYFIGTEGKKTEVLYFQMIAEFLIGEYESYRDRIEVPNLTIEGMGTSNFKLIEDVEEYLRKDPRVFENVWLVFDKDDIPDDYFDNAIASIRQKGFKAAWTNDSFELWLLLHFEFLQSGITRNQYKEKLSNYLISAGMGQYEKNSKEIMGFLLDKRNTAIKNAERLEGCHETDCPPSKRNPCTMVHHLMNELLQVESAMTKIQATEKYHSHQKDSN